MAIGASSRADAIGLLSRPVTCLDKSAIQKLHSGMAKAGIGQIFLSEPHRQPCSDQARFSSLQEKINETFEQSPAPSHEWRTLLRVLGLELLAFRLGISQSSARRYRPGGRFTPVAIAVRLHFLA
ncbi:MAG: hypothetical protein OXI87_00760 [Albidovulum sp.]|nr:hypothetical protein [Albidovulum sp.]